MRLVSQQERIHKILVLGDDHTLSREESSLM